MLDFKLKILLLYLLDSLMCFITVGDHCVLLYGQNKKRRKFSKYLLCPTE